jgi:hypothetical protein
MMRHTPSITAGISCDALPERVRPTRTRSIFRSVIEALHHSRRLQAERVLIQYRHLIDRTEGRFINELYSNAGEHERADK